jgi:hypothetical protein
MLFFVILHFIITSTSRLPNTFFKQATTAYCYSLLLIATAYCYVSPNIARIEISTKANTHLLQPVHLMILNSYNQPRHMSPY